MVYIPDRGDIIWINFNPTLGHEQAKHRPALVLSPKIYNEKTSLCVICAMTSKVKNRPFEVKINNKSAVLSDQIRAVDWRARGARFSRKVEKGVIDDVTAKIAALIM